MDGAQVLLIGLPIGMILAGCSTLDGRIGILKDAVYKGILYSLRKSQFKINKN